jgi:hypothetical protein
LLGHLVVAFEDVTELSGADFLLQDVVIHHFWHDLGWVFFGFVWDYDFKL